jgi:regulator of cell morphogenesis and NO signaling
LNAPELDWSLPDWLIDRPSSLAVFERLGLDYSCGGKSLEYVCRERGLDPKAVLQELRAAHDRSSQMDSPPPRRAE